MKWSYYNVEREIVGESKVLIFNTLSQLLVVLDKSTVQSLKNTGSCKDKDVDNELIQYKILVNDDEVEKQKVKINILKARFEQRFLDLTILPTYLCNFTCDYCFEKSIRDSAIIAESTIDKIIEFIKKFTAVEDLCVRWYGGEPTLAIDQMEEITRKIKDLKKNFYSILITNGYLIDRLVPDKIGDLKIKVIQVTIDGEKDTHNKRRQHSYDRDTYSKIILNLQKIIECNNDVEIIVRVNIDEGNSSDIKRFRKEVEGLFPSQRVKIIPGFVTSFSEGCATGSTCYINAEEKIDFLIDNFQQEGSQHPTLIPNAVSEGCIARHINSFVFDPHGHIYKCMAVVGDKNQMIGDINNEDWLKDEDVLMKFLKKDDFLDNPICNDCKFFPVCNENCILSNEELSVRCRATAKVVDNYMNNMCKEVIDG